MNDKDCIYAEPLPVIDDFIFDAGVARVFPDMINRSVPGYANLLEMLGVLARDTMSDGGRCYDLGCSLGAVSYAVSRASRDRAIEIIAVDNSPAMIERLQQRVQSHPPAHKMELQCADIQDVTIEKAALVVLNLTLQFIAPSRRLALLQNIHRGLRPDGVLIVTEKLRFAPEDQDALDRLHLAFKRAQGYSDLEISQKRSALEQVMITDSLQTHDQRFHEAGFSRNLVWFQCLNFVSLMAWK
jgi:tRNA (cmo5U34)-methyltransferase